MPSSRLATTRRTGFSRVRVPAHTGAEERSRRTTNDGTRRSQISRSRWTTLSEDDQAAVFFRLAATHRGDFLGLPATGKRIEFRGVMLLRFENDLIAHERRLYDFSGLLIKLGILRVKPG